MNFKETLDFELNFVSNHMPFAEIESSSSFSNYFCIYRCYFSKDIIIYQIQPNLITTINYKNNVISKSTTKENAKIKPIASVDPKNGDLYFFAKDQYNYYIYRYLNQKIVGKYTLDKNYDKIFTKILVYDNHVFLINNKTVSQIYKSSKKHKEFPDIIVSSTCNHEYLVLLFMNQVIKFFNIDSLNEEKQIICKSNYFDPNLVYIYTEEDKIYILLQQKLLIQKDISDEYPDSGSDVGNLYLHALQDMNKNFISKSVQKKKFTKYNKILNLVSEIYFTDENYDDNILFFGPSFYLPIQKHVPKCLYSKLNEIKNNLLYSNDEFTQSLKNFSENGDIQQIINNVNELLKVDTEGLNLNDEINYFLSVIKLPENIREEPIIPSSFMPYYFKFIIAEIINTFINLLIIKSLYKDMNNGLENEISIYSSLFRLISSDLVQYIPNKSPENELNIHHSNENDNNNNNNDDDDVVVDDIDNGDEEIGPGNNDTDNNFDSSNDESSIQSNLYILNSSFSPASLRQQVWFLYQGNLTFSKLSNMEIIKYNSLCPGPYVEQRVLDVARAYLEINDFEKCIEYINKVGLHENDCAIQNIYISHLIKQIPDDFEKQFQILKALNMRLPKNMIKSLYIIALKANHFAEAVNHLFSKDALKSFILELKKNQELTESNKQEILEVLEEKECDDIISLMN